MRRIIITWSILLLIAVFGCKEPYEPTIISSPDSYLVIEGVLNAGQGPTAIRVSRTYKLDDTAKLRGETNATVLIEGNDNTVRQLNMTSDGVYSSAGLGLSMSQEYRLKIITANGKEYLSDYVVPKANAPIDSLEFEQNDKGVQIYANTHDPTNNSRYYLWDFDETWEIRTVYYSRWKYVNGVVLERTPADDVSTCWKYSISKNILIGTSASLQNDVIRRAPINFIGNGDEKLDVRYSILLRQYALDKAGYEFYEMMRKSTESLGTIFDAQPSQVKGNIRCISDPGELVIGYVFASVIEEKRFFIRKADLLRGWRYFQDCPADTIPNHPDSIKLAYDIGTSIYNAIYAMFSPDIVAYEVSYTPCVDCTARGGFLGRPSYW